MPCIPHTQTITAAGSCDDSTKVSTRSQLHVPAQQGHNMLADQMQAPAIVYCPLIPIRWPWTPPGKIQHLVGSPAWPTPHFGLSLIRCPSPSPPPPTPPPSAHDARCPSLQHLTGPRYSPMPATRSRLTSLSVLAGAAPLGN